MLVLGISGLEHDAAAALLGDRGVLAAIEEDKLARTPRLGAIPRLAMDFALRQAGAVQAALDVIGLATHPRRAWQREEKFRLELLFSRPGSAYHTGSLGRAYRAWSHLRVLRSMVHSKTRILSFEHHWCHAASAYYSSPFDQALILTLDEAGDMWSGFLAQGQGDEIRPLVHLGFPNSLGWFFTAVTEMLGLRPHLDEQKTQWLGRNGSLDLLPAFRRFFHGGANGTPVFNRRYLGNGLEGHWQFSPAARRDLGLTAAESPRDVEIRPTIARSAQEFLEETVISLAEKFRKQSGAKYLAVAGGVFMNSLLVRAMEERTGFERVFVQPAAGNAGTSLGAAFLARKRLAGKSGREPLTTLDWGPEFAPGEVKATLDNTKVIYRYLPAEDELFEETLRLLEQGKIVAWCQGRAEFGLRALGNRSLIASPFSPYVLENLNRYIKHREGFHPFALSVPAEDLPGLFDAGPNCRFLCSMGDLRAENKELGAFVFRGRQVRLHVVEKESSPRFWGLLRAFGRRAPAPVLVNASYNLFGEPLVVSARDALRSFYCSGTDALALGNFLVVK
jgi:carbamoyltransferase